MPRIEDGKGKNGFAAVTRGQALLGFSVTESETQAATDAGFAFNINTGIIALTGSSESGVLYFKNDEPPVNGQSDYIITTIVVGLGNRSATVTDDAVVTVYRNPTGGTLVDAASAAAITSNQNFGSSRTLSSTTLIYKATASNQTLTGGTTHLISFTAGPRLAIPLSLNIPRGSSLGITIDLNTSGGANVYVALIGYRKDGSNTVG